MLGFEALSRGAAAVTLVDVDAQAVDALETLGGRLGADAAATVVAADALAFLAGEPAPYDVVFLDPPFDSELLEPCLDALAAGWLAADAVVYVEQARGAVLADARWTVLKAGDTRQVHYALLARAG